MVASNPYLSKLNNSSKDGGCASGLHPNLFHTPFNEVQTSSRVSENQSYAVEPKAGDMGRSPPYTEQRKPCSVLKNGELDDKLEAGRGMKIGKKHGNEICWHCHTSPSGACVFHGGGIPNVDWIGAWGRQIDVCRQGKNNGEEEEIQLKSEKESTPQTIDEAVFVDNEASHEEGLVYWRNELANTEESGLITPSDDPEDEWVDCDVGLGIEIELGIGILKDGSLKQGSKIKALDLVVVGEDGMYWTEEELIMIE